MKQFIIAIATLTIGLSVFSQTNFSGTWKLTSKEHIAGPEYVNALPNAITVTQTKDSIFIETSFMDAEGKESKSRSATALNGKQSITKSGSSKRKYTRSLAWNADKKTLTLTIIFSIPEIENEVDFTRIETWSIVDGKLTIQKKSIETRSETWEVKGVYERQADSQ